MPLHTFPVQSVPESIIGGDSIEVVYRLIRTYLTEHNQSGETNEKHMKCLDRTAIVTAIGEFASWSQQRPHDEPKLLWVSLHGMKPSNPHHVGTRGLSAAFSTSDVNNQEEIVDWWAVLNGVRGVCPPNVVVLMDVCWGGSPSAPASFTRGSGNPRLLFGPIRAAHRLELDTATGLILGTLIGGTIPSVEKAKAIVGALNNFFPEDPTTKKEFYRVWWWNEDGHHECFPAPKPIMKRVM